METRPPVRSGTMLAVLCLTLGATLSCGGGESPVAPITVAEVVIISPTVAPTFQTITRSLQFSAEARDAKGTVLLDRTIAWSTSAPAVASVSSSGVVTAVGPGTATIQASSEGHSSPGVSVTVAPVAASIVLDHQASTLGTQGRDYPLLAVLRDSAGTQLGNRTPAFTSSDTSVATVNSSGVVRARKNGTANIFAAADGALDTCAVTVNLVVTGVTLAPGSVAFGARGSHAQVTATAHDSMLVAVAGTPVGLTVLDTTVASVSPAGLLTSRGPGSTTLVASAGATSTSIVVSVQLLRASLRITPRHDTLFTAARQPVFHVTALDSNGYDMGPMPAGWTVVNSPLGGQFFPYWYAWGDSAQVPVLGVGSPSFVRAALPAPYPVSDSVPVVVALQPVSLEMVRTSNRTDTSFTVDSLFTHRLFDGSANTDFLAAVTVVDSGGGRTLFGVPLQLVTRDTAVATINVNGYIRIHGNGRTWAVATAANGVSDSMVVHVVLIPVVFAAGCWQFPVQCAVPFTALGETYQPALLEMDSSGTPMHDSIAFAMASGGSSIVTLASGPTLTSNSVGDDTLLATVQTPAGPITSRIPVHVFQDVRSIVFSPAAETLATTGDTLRLHAITRDSLLNPTTQEPSYWASSAPLVADVDQTGLVTAHGDGVAIIGASIWVTGQDTIVVRRYASAFDLRAPLTTLTVGSTTTMTGAARDSAGVLLPLTWTSRNAAVATATTTGDTTATIRGVAAGTTWIVLSGGTRRDSVAVTVN